MARVVVACCVLALAGCSGGSSSWVSQTGSAPAASGGAIRGMVHGGQQGISGAHVYVFAANTTGYGDASVSLLQAGAGTTLDASGGPTNDDYYVTTDAGGNFSVTGDYSCSAGTQIYVYALGGNPGAGVNQSIGLMAALGDCASLPAYLTVNEVSTIAAAYALAGFATDATHVSSSGTALAQTGVKNAFANATNLVNVATGAALATTPAGNGTVPQADIYTLADILAACVNSTGAVSGPANPTACYTLFNNALAGGSSGAAPVETATAAINIAHYPAASVAALYDLALPMAPFAPGLGAQPNDFTISLVFTGGELSYEVRPLDIAIDASGNVWVPTLGGTGVIEFSNSGAIISGNGFSIGGLYGPDGGIAIDGAGDAWVAAGNSVAELSSSGAVLLDVNVYASGIAVDGSGNAWVAGGMNVAELSSSGAILSEFNYTPFSEAGDDRSIAVNGGGNLWINDDAGVTALSSSGAVLSATPVRGEGGFDQIAVDGSGNAWAPGILSVTEVSNSGNVLSGTSGYTGGGVYEPGGIAIDGAGNVWMSSISTLSEFSNSGVALSSASGYRAPLATPFGIAIDGSGDVWAADFGAATVVETLGAATPVITPICAGLPATPTADGSSNLGTRP
jgi:hypothetical protein